MASTLNVEESTRIRPSTQTGFTLFELLVVMLILGLLASFAVLGIGSTSGRQLEQEARRLVALAELARDQALLTGQLRALGFSRDGYAFLQMIYLDSGQVTWVPLDEPPLHERSLAARGIEPVLRLQGRRVALEPGVGEPHVIFNGAGEMIPFELELRPPGAATQQSLLVLGAREGRLWTAAAPR